MLTITITLIGKARTLLGNADLWSNHCYIPREESISERNGFILILKIAKVK